MSTKMLNNRKRRPTHPGELLKEDILPAAGINQSDLAKRLGVSRRTVNLILQQHRGVSADMAHRLARAFDTTPEFWLNMQQAVDVWEALEENKAIYEGIRPLKVA